MAIKEEAENGGSSCCNDDNCNSSLSEEEEEEENIKKKERSSNCRKSWEPDPEPCAHGYVGAINKMSGTRPTWFCTKQLTDSDVRTTQNRLLFPKLDTDRLLGLLTQRERSELQTAGGKGIEAGVVDEMGRVWNMRLNFWASKSYNLNGDWRWLVKKLDLSEGDVVKVGAFRYPASASASEQALGFILRVQSLAPKNHRQNPNPVTLLGRRKDSIINKSGQEEKKR